MNIYTALYENLTQALDLFISEVKKADIKNQIYDIWDIKDIVCHITFWHINYAENLEAEERNEKPSLLKGKYTTINLEGVQSINSFSLSELVEKLIAANKRIGNVIKNGKVRKMTYKDGSRDYTIPEFLEIVTRHINSHTKDIKRANKRNISR